MSPASACLTAPATASWAMCWGCGQRASPRRARHGPSTQRCSCVQPDPGTGTRLVNDEALSLYIELNTSHRLDVADTKNMPPSEL
ncbi:uncharacterized protein HaLaN_05871, partial [Haematococcus lacustris]